MYTRKTGLSYRCSPRPACYFLISSHRLGCYIIDGQRSIFVLATAAAPRQRVLHVIEELSKEQARGKTDPTVSPHPKTTRTSRRKTPRNTTRSCSTICCPHTPSASRPAPRVSGSCRNRCCASACCSQNPDVTRSIGPRMGGV